MIKAYLNYPDRHVTIHRNPNCAHAQTGPHENRRYIILNADTVSKELKKFAGHQYPFAAEAGKNDMWLNVDFFDTAFEEALVAYIKRLVGQHYAPIAEGDLKVHC